MLIVGVRDFTILPGARHRDDGDGSADQFFEEYIDSILDKALSDKREQLTIDLDGTLGYASSFISQLAVRIKDKINSKRLIKKKIIIKSNDDKNQEERFWNEIG